MHFVLFYDYVSDYLERRSEFRDAHLKLARPYIDRGELLLGGAFADPADGAMLLSQETRPTSHAASPRPIPMCETGW